MYDARMTLCYAAVDQVTDEADEWTAATGLPSDPEWTESNWLSDEPSIELYQVLSNLDISILDRWMFR